MRWGPRFRGDRTPSKWINRPVQFYVQSVWLTETVWLANSLEPNLRPTYRDLKPFKTIVNLFSIRWFIQNSDCHQDFSISVALSQSLPPFASTFMYQRMIKLSSGLGRIAKHERNYVFVKWFQTSRPNQWTLILWAGHFQFRMILRTKSTRCFRIISNTLFKRVRVILEILTQLGPPKSL